LVQTARTLRKLDTTHPISNTRTIVSSSTPRYVFHRFLALFAGQRTRGKKSFCWTSRQPCVRQHGLWVAEMQLCATSPRPLRIRV